MVLLSFWFSTVLAVKQMVFSWEFGSSDFSVIPPIFNKVEIY